MLHRVRTCRFVGKIHPIQGTLAADGIRPRGGQASGAYLRLSSTNYGFGYGKKFGLHPRFTFLKQLYNEGKATFCANVGSLIQPIAN